MPFAVLDVKAGSGDAEAFNPFADGYALQRGVYVGRWKQSAGCPSNGSPFRSRRSPGRWPCRRRAAGNAREALSGDPKVCLDREPMAPWNAGHAFLLFREEEPRAAAPQESVRNDSDLKPVLSTRIRQAVARKKAETLTVPAFSSFRSTSRTSC